MKQIYKYLSILICQLVPFILLAQNDSIKEISVITLDGYKKPSALLNSTKSALSLSGNFIKLNPPARLLESINLIPGTTLEERSPGSYRLTIRGSALRSPYGVRNIKVY